MGKFTAFHDGSLPRSEDLHYPSWIKVRMQSDNKKHTLKLMPNHALVIARGHEAKKGEWDDGSQV